MNLEFPKRIRKEESMNGELIQELKSIGLTNLESVEFVNMRINHGSDIAVPMSKLVSQMIEKENPDIVLYEAVGIPDEEMIEVQKEIDGTSPLNHIKPDPNPFYPHFTRSMLLELHKLHSIDAKFAPIVISSDLKNPETLKKVTPVKNNFEKILDEITEPNPDIAREIFRTTVSEFAKVQLQRNQHIINSILHSLSINPRLKDLKDRKHLKIVGTYGAQHGALSNLFENKGAKTSSIGVVSLDPASHLLSRFELTYLNGDKNEEVTDKQIEMALIGNLIFKALKVTIFKGAEDIRVNELERPRVAWIILDELYKEGHTFDSLYNLYLRKTDEYGHNELDTLARDRLIQMYPKIKAKREVR